MKIFKLLLVIGIISFFSFTLPKNVLKKVNKEIVKLYETENFKLENVSISEDAIKTLSSKFNAEDFYKIIIGEELAGYAYVDKAPSKTAQFDYLIILDQNLAIKKAKVLIYREEYGGEISSKRWLKQFIGKVKGHVISLNEDIIPISGATISVRSMTNAVNELLESLDYLHKNNSF